jgi:dTDP-4-amino-4,6-dideoxygalactose transaminase
MYDEQLRNVVEAIPVVRPWAEHVYYAYVVQVPERDQFRQRLQQQGVSTGVHYPVPLHLQPACASYGYKRGMFPVTEAASERIVSLPIYPEMTQQQYEYVVQAVKSSMASHAVR